MAVNSGPDGIVQDGLVFYIDAANTNQNSTDVISLVPDQSGSFVTGSLSATGVWQPGNAGYWNFDAISDKILLPNESTGNPTPAYNFGNNDYTISYWIDFISSQVIFDTGPQAGYIGGVAYQLYISMTNTFIGLGRADIYIHQYYPANTGDPGFNVAGWTNCTLTRVGTSSKWYINGELKSTDTDSTTWRASGSSGASISGYGGSAAEGEVSNFMIYNGKGLSASEVKQNYNALKGRFI